MNTYQIQIFKVIYAPVPMLRDVVKWIDLIPFCLYNSDIKTIKLLNIYRQALALDNWWRDTAYLSSLILQKMILKDDKKPTKQTKLDNTLTISRVQRIDHILCGISK